MNYRNAILFIAIAILLLIGLHYLVPRASAVVYTIGQGDAAYMFDTVDLSLAASWPDYQLAWCADNEPGCSNPFIVDLGDENQHRVVLEPPAFKVGNYFRWDGDWHSGENLDAFRILPGKRPENITVVEIGNVTTTADKVTYPAKDLPNSTHLLLARGDTLTYNYAIPNETKGNKAFMWMFHTDRDAAETGILGEQMNYQSNDSVYDWEINQTVSEGLFEGRYSGYIQYSGYNNRQDIFYRPMHNVKQFENHSVLDTLYDDYLVPDVPIEGLTPSLVKSRLEGLSNIEYSDDMLIPVTMEVDTPIIVFSDYSTEGNNITVSGTTTMSEGTILTFTLDKQNYALPEDIAKHTWRTQAVGKNEDMRTFNITMPIIWTELAIGANHTVIASVDKYKIHTETSKDFKVTDVYIVPTPTPERERVVLEEYGWHRVTPTETITETPIATVNIVPSVVSVNESVIVVGNGSMNVTTTPTMAVPTPKPIPTPTRDPNIHVPLPWWVGIVAMVVVAVWRRKG